LGGSILGILSVFEVFYTLSTLGQSIFGDVVIGSVLKEFFSFQIFLGLSCTVLAFSGSSLFVRGHLKASVTAGVLSACLGFLSVVNPLRYGFTPSTTLMVGGVVGVVFILSGAVLGHTSRRRQVIEVAAKVSRGPLLRSVEVATTAVFSALYAALILLVFIPSPTGGYTHIGDAVVFLSGLLFGPKVGSFVGILGSVTADVYTSYPRWYVSILAHGLEGLIPGLMKGKRFSLQVVACLAGGFLMASTYFVVNVFLKGYPLAVISFVRDLFFQAGVSMIIALLVSNMVKRVLPQFR
jgi:uncharacterized membrane protein